MFGLDENTPHSFTEQITTPPTAPSASGEDTVSRPLTRAELKAKQSQALKELIAQDLGVDSDTLDDDTQAAASLPVWVQRLNSVWHHGVDSVFTRPVVSDISGDEATTPDTDTVDNDGVDELISLINTNTEDVSGSAHDTSLSGADSETMDALVLDDDTTDDIEIPVDGNSAVDDVDDSDPADQVLVTETLDDSDDELVSDSESTDTVVDDSEVSLRSNLTDISSLSDTCIFSPDIRVDDTTCGHGDQKTSSPTDTRSPVLSALLNDDMRTGASSDVAESHLVVQHRGWWRLVLIIGSSLLAVIVLLTGGVAWSHSHAISMCENANTTYAAAYKDYEKAYKTVENTAREITSADQVTDKTTYDKLTELKNKKLTKTASLNCDISFLDSFTYTTDPLKAQTSEVQKTTSDMDKAVKNVKKSKDKKDLDNAKSQAQSTLDEANALYASSEGQVQDNATRDSLKTRIDEAQKVLTDKKATVDELNKALAPLSDAMNEVNQSIQAKAQADEQARQAQAQAEAQAQQQQSQSQQSQRSVPQRRSSGGSTQRRSGGNSGGSSGGSGSWSVPGEQGEAYLPGSLG